MNQKEWVIGQCRIYNLVKHLQWSPSVRVVNGFSGLTIFPKKAPSQMFDWIPSKPPIVGVVNGG